MASRTSLYSFQNNIIEINISIDAIGELHEPNQPLSTEERAKFGLCNGENPWRHLGVPDFAISKNSTSEKEKHDDSDRVQEEVTDNEATTEVEGRKRSLSNASICTEEMLMEMEELSKDWADGTDENILKGMFDLLEPPRIKLSISQLKIQKTTEIRSNILNANEIEKAVDSDVNAMSVV